MSYGRQQLYNFTVSLFFAPACICIAFSIRIRPQFVSEAVVEGSSKICYPFCAHVHGQDMHGQPVRTITDDFERRTDRLTSTIDGK